MWTIDDFRAGVLTLDFVTPIVDNPEKWGEIAAANAISDIFAMGGKPFVALNIVGFPIKTLGLDILEKILRGGHRKVSEAGAFLVGGHSVEDEEPKYGLSVYGEVELSRMWKVTGSEAGDVLILTKPIGTGVISTAIKADMVEDPSGPEEAEKWMSTLNDVPLKLNEDLLRNVKACTDVTGFGLAGHLLDMLSDGELDFSMNLENIPLLPGTIDLAEMGLLPAGTYNNRIQYEDRVMNRDAFPESLTDMVFDAQTSGGLLLSLPEENASETLHKLRQTGFSSSCVIGHFLKGNGNIQLDK